MCVVLASVVNATITVLVNMPVKVLATMFVARMTGGGLTTVIRPTMRLLTTVPSMVCKLLKLVILGPLVCHLRGQMFTNDAARRFANNSGLLSTVVILTVVVLPAIVGVDISSVHTMPKRLGSTSLTLKTARVRAVFGIVVPTTESNVVANMILKVKHTLKRTVTVGVITKNSMGLPFPFGSMHFLAARVIDRVDCTRKLRQRMLFAMNLMLFVFVVVVGLILTRIRGGKTIRG